MKPKYQPTDDEPRIVRENLDLDGELLDIVVGLEGFEQSHDDEGSAEAEVQRVALAIADRVHGAELAALREALHGLVDAVTRVCDWSDGTRVGDALVAAEAVLEGESDHGS